MALVQDINITTGATAGYYDLDFYNGDFKIIPSDQNHITLIIYSNLGAFKQFPLVGVGIFYYMASPANSDIIKRNITVQLVNDGYTVNAITVLPNSNVYYVDAIRNTQ